jgi:hypothetical protein
VYAQGQLVGSTVTKGGAFFVIPPGSPVAFTVPLVDHTKPYKLCYMFGDEPWKLFDVFVVSSQVNTMTATTVGVDGQASVGETKPFAITGYGVGENDRISWAPFTATSDRDCVGGEYNLSTGMGITQPVTGFYGDLLQSDLTFEVNFTVPSIIRQPHRLCYGFGIEPLKLYAQPALGIDAKYLQETTAQYAIVNVNTSVTFFSEHITGGDVGEVDPLVQDRAKWVVGKLRDQMDADTSENVLQGYDNVDCTDDPAPGTEIVPVTRDSILPLGKATFLFHVPYDVGDGSLQPSDAFYAGTRLRLCYAFGSETFHLYYGQTMLPLTPRISNMSSNVAVQDVKKTYIFEGSLGITENDTVKWVDYYASCETNEGLGGETDVVAKPMGSDDPRTYASFTFNTAPAEGYQWKLCYRFGDGPYVSFPQMRMQVKRIDNVTLLEGSSVDTLVGNPLTILFDGLGIEDGDTVKLVPKGYGCTVVPAGGSEVGIVSERKATFLFSANADGLALCYAFQDEPFKLYAEIPLVKPVAAAEEVALSQRQVEVRVTLTFNLDYSTLAAEGTPAREAFKQSVAIDLATVLGISRERILITAIRPGSIIIEFTILPAVDGSEILAEQAALILEEQVADPTSTLYTSPAITIISQVDATKSLPLPTVVSISDIPEVVQKKNESAFKINVLNYQTSGLFNFEVDQVVATEDQGYINITVLRQHGTNGLVRVGYISTGKTATARNLTLGIPGDYEEVEGILNFTDGQSTATFSVAIYDDDIYETAYETVSIVINLLPNAGAATASASLVGSQNTITVKIYDFDDGDKIVSSVFSGTGGYLSYLQGWMVTGNGIHNPLWVDDKGLYSVDQSFIGKLSPRPLCAAGVSAAEAITLQCEIPCSDNQNVTNGGNANVFDVNVNGGIDTSNAYATDPSFTTPIVLNGSGYIATAKNISDFPMVDISVTMWIRTTDVSQAGTLLSFSPISPSNTSLLKSKDGSEVPYYEFAILDQRSVRVAVRDHVDMTWRYPAIETNVVLNDGTWHHVVVTWSSQNGNVVLYKDGAKVFDSLENDGEPYRKGVEMERNGVVMVGNVPLSTTQCNLSPISQPCNILPNSGLIGAVQNIRMYTEVLGSKGAVDDFLWPYFDHSNLQLKLYWRSIVSTFVNGNYNATINNLAIGNLKRQSIAEINAHVGITSMQGVAPLETSTIRSPCVEDDIWYFTAPSIFLGDFKKKMYNGRLQFQMLSPSNSGYERTRTGMVYVTGADGVTIANSVSGFIAPSAGKWTSYTIPFREDQGWSYYETGEAITFKNFRNVLSNLTSVQIRGDDRVCSNQGEGQEAVYVQNIYYEVEP